MCPCPYHIMMFIIAILAVLPVIKIWLLPIKNKLLKAKDSCKENDCHHHHTDNKSNTNHE